jgi:hypothetical protein
MKTSIIEKTFRELFGQPCWGIDHSRWLNLWINFGKPSLRVREPYKTKSKSNFIRESASRRGVYIQGQWQLNVFYCFWQLRNNDQLLATGSSSRPRIDRAISKLDGQKLISVQISQKTGATRFKFDLGCVLNCRPIGDDGEADLWTLYKPNGYTVSVQGNGTFCHQPRSQRHERFYKIKKKISLRCDTIVRIGDGRWSRL